jgi:hypothetical protein
MTTPVLELADIFRLHGPAYLARESSDIAAAIHTEAGTNMY